LSLRSPLLGPHNLENLLAAAGVGLGLGLSLEQVEAGLASCRAVPGRLQEIFNDQGIKVLVDYAHSDDALHNVLGALRPLTRGALITVFGCGGERDKGKRPLMGAAASLYSELSVVTSDNPRREDPDAIIQDILPGMQGEALAGNGLEAGSRRWVVEPDRRAAIRLAIALARPGDTVLIAGKGHEDYQIVGESRLHFDDREEAARALQEVRA
jgi:UDP-N-acetylmuramyl-tripeptide synthetase